MPAQHVLQLVTDRLESRLPLDLAVARAVRGGVDMVQVREKGAPADALLAAAQKVQAGCSDRAAVLVNDRIDVALAAGASGVHLARRSLPPDVARALLPASEGWLVGASVHSLAAAVAAAEAGADYVTFGHIFPTGSKPGLPARGLEGLAAVVAAVPIPVLAIGGIGPSNVAAVLRTGCAGVAVISAVLGAADPGRAAAELRQAMDAADHPPAHALAAGAREARRR